MSKKYVLLDEEGKEYWSDTHPLQIQPEYFPYYNVEQAAEFLEEDVTEVQKAYNDGILPLKTLDGITLIDGDLLVMYKYNREDYFRIVLKTGE